MREDRAPSDLTVQAHSYGFPEVIPLEVEAGPSLYRLLSDPYGRFVRELEPLMRQGLLLELGVRFPTSRIVLNDRLDAHAYVLRISEIPEGTGSYRPEVALTAATVEELSALGIAGDPATNPATGRPCSRAADAHVQKIDEASFETWDSLEAVVLELSSVLRRHAAVFLGIQETTEILAEIQAAQPALIAETVPRVVSIFQLTDVLRRLVEEDVSIRDIRTILHALAEWGQVEQDTVMLAEYVRTALSRQLTHRYSNKEGRLFVYLLDGYVEDLIATAMEDTPVGVYLSLDADVSKQIVDAIKAELPSGPDGVVLTTMGIRRVVKRLVEPELPHLAVLSYQELTTRLKVEPLARIEIKNQGLE